MMLKLPNFRYITFKSSCDDVLCEKKGLKIKKNLKILPFSL